MNPILIMVLVSIVNSLLVICGICFTTVIIQSPILCVLVDLVLFVLYFFVNVYEILKIDERYKKKNQ